MSIVAGVDFGTLNVRVSVVDSERGVLCCAAADYPVGRTKSDPDYATQSHHEHMRAFVTALRRAITGAGITGHQIDAVALDTTGSTVVPVAQGMVPLDEYYLWCDHRAKSEAAQITDAARRQRLPAIEWYGGVYSSEWGFSKLLHWLRHNPDKRDKLASAFQHCDMVAATTLGSSEQPST